MIHNLWCLDSSSRDYDRERAHGAWSRFEGSRIATSSALSHAGRVSPEGCVMPVMAVRSFPFGS